jgi:hypothetical protein
LLLKAVAVSKEIGKTAYFPIEKQKEIFHALRRRNTGAFFTEYPCGNL